MPDLPDNYVIFSNSDRELNESLEKVVSQVQKLIGQLDKDQDEEKRESLQSILDRFAEIRQLVDQDPDGKLLIESYMFKQLF